MAIFITTFLLWFLIAERFLFLKFGYRKLASSLIQKWTKRDNKSSWNSQKIRELHLSQMRISLFKNINLIKTLVVLCPLLGLLGTVTGMISVFDVMALTGTGNARLMASGISKATIPTMAGMVAALSGLYFGSYFEYKAEMEHQKITDQLPVD